MPPRARNAECSPPAAPDSAGGGLGRPARTASTPLPVQGRRLAGAGPGGGAAAAAGGAAAGR